MDIFEFVDAVTVDGSAAPDPALRRRAFRHAAHDPLAAVDDALVRAASGIGIAHRPMRDFLFDAAYPVLRGVAGADYLLSAVTLFGALQIGMRRFMPSGRQGFVQIGSDGGEAFACVARAIPLQPGTLHLIEEEAAPAGGWLPFRRKKEAAEPPAPEPAMAPSVAAPSRRDLALRAAGGFYRVERHARPPAELEMDGRLGFLVLSLLPGVEDYLRLLQLARPLLTAEGAVVAVVPRQDADALAAGIARAFPVAGGDALRRRDYAVADGTAARSLLVLPARLLDPPAVPPLREVKARLAGTVPSYRFIGKGDPAFAGETVEVSPAETVPARAPLFLDNPGRVPPALRQLIEEPGVALPPVRFSRLEGGAVILGMTRFEMLKRAFGKLDPVNVGKPPTFPTLVQDRAGNVIAENSRAYDKHHYITTRPDGSEWIATSYAAERHIPGDCLLVYGSEANSHWLFEGFFPLHAVSRLGIAPTLLVTHEIQPYQLAMLEALGYGPDRVTLTRTEERITCDRLFAYDTQFTITRDIVAFMEDFAARQRLRNGAAPLRPTGERIYVARTDARWVRRFLNENELIDGLVDLGFDIVVPSELGVPELVDVFGRARTIVGPNGAGLLNAIYSAPGARIVALTCELYYEQHVKRLAELKGHALGWIFGESFLSEDRVFAGSHSDWIIDVPATLGRVRRLLETEG